MEMPREQAEKLKRYFINAAPFLWGVLEAKNKKKRLEEIKKLGFLSDYSEGSNPTYSKVNQDLLVELGIEGILERILVPKVTNGFVPEVLRYFRRCWEQGQTPDKKYLKDHRLYRSRVFTTGETFDGWRTQPPIAGYKDPAYVFVQIDAQHDFVERWTVFAGLWFEEIEPWLREIEAKSG